MQTLRPLALGFALALLALPARAQAQAPLVMEEPRSGLHLEVPGGCSVKPAGDAACASFAASAHQAERFAVVLHDGSLLSYSVAMFADPEPGAGEERARKVAKTLGDADPPSIVTYGGQPFLRADLHPSNGAAVCFVTIDDRPEVAIVMFASDRALASTTAARAEEVMRTVRRTPAAAAPAPPAKMSTTWQVLITLLVAFVFGLPMVRVINRRLAAARKRPR